MARVIEYTAGGNTWQAMPTQHPNIWYPHRILDMGGRFYSVMHCETREVVADRVVWSTATSEAIRRNEQGVDANLMIARMYEMEAIHGTIPLTPTTEQEVTQ